MTDMMSAAAGKMVSWPPARGRGPGSRSGGPSRGVQGADPAGIRPAGSGRERGALLRREGLYTSHISDWRRSRQDGAASGLADKPGGRPARSTEAVENERLRKENDKLTAELTRTKAALEIMGKAHALLELLSESADTNAKRQR